jgi:hypothetical protein
LDYGNHLFLAAAFAGLVMIMAALPTAADFAAEACVALPLVSDCHFSSLIMTSKLPQPSRLLYALPPAGRVP